MGGAGAACALALGCSDKPASRAPDGGRADAPRGADGGAGADAPLGPDARARDAGRDARVADAASVDGAAADGPGIDPVRLPESPSFPQGVASGDVTAERALLWGRYTGGATLRLWVWPERGRTGVLSRDLEARPGADGVVLVDVDGLPAGTRHRFALVELEAGRPARRSPVGRFVTAPAAGARPPLVLGVTSCTKEDHVPFPVLSRAAALELDAFLLLGDTVYADGARTPDEYRAVWHAMLATDGYRALRASTSVVATWDDHEVDNNWDPETTPADQLAAARAALFEQLPLRRDPAAPDRLWRSLRYGDTAEVFVLDCRGERRPSTRGSAAPIYVSRAQLDWLEAGLVASPATFKLVMSSVPIGDFPLPFDAASAQRWEGYGAQRDEILAFIDDRRIGGLLWLSGDFHLGAAGRVEASGVGSTQLEICAGPGGHDANPLSALLGAPQWDFATTEQNFVRLALDPDARTAEVTFLDASGGQLYQRRYAFPA